MSLEIEVLKFPSGEEETRRLIEEALGSRYRVIRKIGEGSTRVVYEAEFIIPGLGTQKRAIKIDKEPEGIKAERYTLRGFTTANDAAVLFQLQNPESHFVTRLHDYADLRERGISASISVEEYFESKTLAERVKNGPLNSEESEKVFSQLIEAIRYLHKDNNLHHRDVKPQNILVDSDLEVRLTDLANARDMDEAPESAFPTAGSHMTMDPTVIGEFFGDERAYNSQAEIYALGATMFYALTGTSIVKYNSDDMTGVRTDTGESVLKDGKPCMITHEETLKTALKKLEGDNKKYYGVLHKALSINPTFRYRDILELKRDFEKATRPNLVERVKKSWKEIGAAVALTGGILTTVALSGIAYINTNFQDRIRTLEKPGIETMWDGETFEIGNTAIIGEVMAYTRRTGEKIAKLFPKDAPVLHTDAGNQVDVVLSARMSPFDEGDSDMSPAFPYCVYIEGWTTCDDERKRYIVPSGFDQAMSRMGGMGFAHNHKSSFTHVVVPAHLKNGVYNLAVEMYEPLPEELNDNPSGIVDFRFSGQGNVIYRKVIPLVVGDVDGVYRISDVYAKGMEESFGVEDPRDSFMDYFKGISFDTFIQGGGHIERREGRKSNWSYMNLPDSRDTSPKIFGVSADKDGETLWWGFIPVESYCGYNCVEDVEALRRAARSECTTAWRGGSYINEGCIEYKINEQLDKEKHWTRLAYPGRDYASQLIEARQEFEQILRDESYLMETAETDSK